MTNIAEHRASQKFVSRRGTVICLIAVFTLLTVGIAAANEPTSKNPSVTQNYTTAAADGAGWLVFKGHRPERADNLAPSTVGLAEVTEPSDPYISGMDRLIRWGAVQATRSAR